MAKQSVKWNKSKTVKVTKAFKESAEGKAIVEIGAAAFESKLTGGLSSDISSGKNWRPLTKRYAKRKGSDKIYVRTGKLLKSVSNNPIPNKEGARKGLAFKMDWKRTVAYIMYLGNKSKAKRDIFFKLNIMRPLFTWVAGDENKVEPNVAKAIGRIFSRGGFIVGVKK